MPAKIISITPQDDVILDLDELVQTPKYIKYKGELHQILEPSVDVYLKVLLLKRRYLRDNAGVEDEYIQVQQAAQLVSGSIPTIPLEDFMKMGMAKLMKITEKIGEATDIAPKDEPEPADASPNALSESSAPSA